MRTTLLALAAASLLLIAITQATAAPIAKSTTQPAKVTVPNVVGMRMDRATRTLRNRGLRVNEECSGLFGCVIKANWWICSQTPRPGTKLRRYSVVVIYGERRGEC